jgi:allantoinase
MPIDLLIHDADVVTSQGVQRLDVAVDGGAIMELTPAIRTTARREINAAGLHLFPGLIDAHVHFNEPGRTDWEGFDTGSAALAAGGGTCFIEMPLNAHPPTLDGESFDRKLAAATANSRTDFALWGGLTPANLGTMEELADRGVVGFKAFMSDSGIDDFGRADDLTLYRGMQMAAKLGLPVAVHAESEELTRRLSAEARSQGRTSIADYLASRPIIAEVDAIRRAIAFAQDTGCSLHIVHVSSAQGCREVAAVRQAGTPGPLQQITCETCPHYLSFTERDVQSIGAPAKCAPPVRSEAEVARLWGELEAGRFDLVASDHSPAPPDMKTDADFFKVWGGIAGVQSTRAVLLSRTPALPLPQVARLTSTHVAGRFRLPNKGDLAPGFDADFALIDLGQQFTLSRDMLLDRHRLSPYVGRRFRGEVRETWVRGESVYRDGKAATAFRGRLVKPVRGR